MRREQRLPSPGNYGGWPWFRLATMVLMLAVLFMLMMRLRDPDVAEALGRLFAPEGQPAGVPAKEPPGGQVEPKAVEPPKQAPGGQVQAAPEGDSPIFASRKSGQSPEGGKTGAPAPPSAAAPQPKPAPEVPLGPADEDPEEADAAREEFQAITDSTLKISVGEMFAYERVVQWVINQPVSVMQKRARTDVRFNDLMLSPDEYRGKLVELTLNARMIRKHEDRGSFGFPLYEVWGFAADSGAWLYDAIVVDLPESLKEASRVNVKIRVVGYFFKLQGYYPARAKPGARAERAPLVIGRVVWAEPGRPETASGTWPWGWIVLGAMVTLVALWWGLTALGRRPGPRRMVASTRRPGAISMDEWLDQAAVGDVPDEPADEDRGKVPGDANGEGTDNGKGSRHAHGHGLDGTPPGADN